MQAYVLIIIIESALDFAADHSPGFHFVVHGTVLNIPTRQKDCQASFEASLLHWQA
jgi:hypothetical protein